ncbi:MAG: flagellar hook-associated protein FlgK [Gammaproteobacteria bacterium]|nr:flagellar hook-associated protein FlgK [Gammaproteobacteria bacterium]
MASGVLGNGLSGLLAAQRALAVASNNISNVNTEGYSRQRVTLATQTPDRLGDFFVGTGVTISSIERVYDEFNTLQIRTVTSGSTQADKFYALASQIDTMLSDSDAGVMSALQGFFDSIQTVANDPSSLESRQVMLSEAESLTSRFQNFYLQVSSLDGNVNNALTAAVDEINSLASSIAGINQQILNLGVSGSGGANDLLDHRDELIRQLSEQVAVSTVAQNDGTVNVYIGNGQALVTGSNASGMTITANAYDPERKEVAFVTTSGPVIVSSQLSGGEIGGILQFRSQVLDPTLNKLGQLAISVTATFNAQHAMGIDLNGAAGGDFFVPIDTDTTISTAQVLPNAKNTGQPVAQVGVTISDTSALTASDYRLERTGSSYTLVRLSDGRTTSLSGFPAASVTIDGLTLSLDSGTIASGDSFLIRPTANGARYFDVAISNPNQIAAASPIRTSASLANTGDGEIDAGAMTDLASFVSDDYRILAADVTAAVADGGTTRGQVTESGGNNSVQYELSINGVLVYSQGSADAALSDLDALAAAINDDVSSTGVMAYVDAGGTSLYLANVPPSAMPITVTESLNTLSGTAEDADTAVGYFSGTTLQGASNPSSSFTYGGAADSYVVLNSADAAVATGAYDDGAAIQFSGIEVVLSGDPNSGDIFTIGPNTNGMSDNRNALALAALQDARLLNGGTASYQDLYGGLVADVGIKTHQADVTGQAQASMLAQAVEARESLSGVNLDEEAANVLRFQQAYAAAAQVIAAANNMFQVLIDSVRR